MNSLLTQKYELIFKSKRVYFITPIISYLHVKGGKYKRRVKLNRRSRETIFSIVDQLIWTSLEQIKVPITGDKYYIIETFSRDKLISAYKVSEEFLPHDFKTLYDTLSKGK